MSQRQHTQRIPIGTQIRPIIILPISTRQHHSFQYNIQQRLHNRNRQIDLRQRGTINTRSFMFMHFANLRTKGRRLPSAHQVTRTRQVTTTIPSIRVTSRQRTFNIQHPRNGARTISTVSIRRLYTRTQTRIAIVAFNGRMWVRLTRR